MKSETFKGTVLSGHKESAVEVPFDPAERWGSQKVRIGPRRLGYAAQATMSGLSFASHLVARSGRFWLLIPLALEQTIGVCPGMEVQVSIHAPTNDTQKT